MLFKTAESLDHKDCYKTFQPSRTYFWKGKWAWPHFLWPHSHDITQVSLPSVLPSHWPKAAEPVNYRTKPRDMQAQENSNLYQAFVSCISLHGKLSKTSSTICHFLFSWNHPAMFCSCHAIGYPLSRPWTWTMIKNHC